jgi:hypothetical protein
MFRMAITNKTTVMATMPLLAGFLALASKFIEAVIKLLEAGTEVGAKSISEVKAEIAGDLRKLKASILVVLDDLDRLIWVGEERSIRARPS